MLLLTVTLLNFCHICERPPFGLAYVWGNSPDTNRLFEPGTALSHGGASGLAYPLRFCSPTPLSSRMTSSLRSPSYVFSFAEPNAVFENHIVRVKSTDADDVFPIYRLGHIGRIILTPKTSGYKPRPSAGTFVPYCRSLEYIPSESSTFCRSRKHPDSCKPKPWFKQLYSVPYHLTRGPRPCIDKATHSVQVARSFFVLRTSA